MAKISKAQIIKALKTEPLKAARWHHNVTNHANKTCEVCAVGAILRQLKWNFSHYEAGLLAFCNRPLANLSKVFEEVSKDHPEKARKAAIAHVRKHFPKILEVEF